MNKFFLYFIALLLFSNSAISNPKINAKTAILMDFNSDEIIYEMDADLSIYPASMTKIMTTIVVFDLLKKEKISLSDEFIVSKRLGDYPRVDIHLCLLW